MNHIDIFPQEMEIDYAKCKMKNQTKMIESNFFELILFYLNERIKIRKIFPFQFTE